MPKPSNWMYLAEVAALTRFATGIMRVLENRPSRQKDPNLSGNEKRQALIERFFVEIVGTAGYMTFLHLGQDLVNKLYHPKLPEIKLCEKSRKRLEAAFRELDLNLKDFHEFDDKINKIVRDVYTVPGKTETRDLVYRVLYGDKMQLNGKETIAKANLATLKEKFKEEFSQVAALKGKEGKLDDAFKAIVAEVKPLKQFAMKNNKVACTAILAGVALSAAIGGTVIQWMNDRLVAPSARDWLKKKFQEIPPKLRQIPIAQYNPWGAIQRRSPMAQPGAAANGQQLMFLSSAPPMPTGALPPMQSTPMANGVANPMTGAEAFSMASPSQMTTQNPSTSFVPAYLPNPKTQAATGAFAANALATPYRVNPLSNVGGGL